MSFDSAVRNSHTPVIHYYQYVVTDNCRGLESVGIACGNTGSRFIGIKANDYYFQTAKRRIEKLRLHAVAKELIVDLLFCGYR